MNRSSPLYVDGKIVYTEANGRWFIYQPTENGLKELSKGRLPSGEERNPGFRERAGFSGQKRE